MKTSVYPDQCVLALAPDARIDCSPVSGLSTLHFSGGSILLSDSAAVILKLCNGRHRRRDSLARLRVMGLEEQFLDVHAFVDAACRRKWIAEIDRSRAPASGANSGIIPETRLVMGRAS